MPGRTRNFLLAFVNQKDGVPEIPEIRMDFIRIRNRIIIGTSRYRSTFTPNGHSRVNRAASTSRTQSCEERSFSQLFTFGEIHSKILFHLNQAKCQSTHSRCGRSNSAAVRKRIGSMDFKFEIPQKGKKGFYSFKKSINARYKTWLQVAFKIYF